jgi:hypothetical protein
LFTQYAYCNAPAFFAAANSAIASGDLKVPRLGIAADGQACPTVRDFFVVDQDQSDNLPTLYLLTSNGTIAQDTRKNRAAFPGATVLGNPSDNRLLDVFLDGALNCKPWLVEDIGDPGEMVPALALNELQARIEQKTPVALVPDGDPMTEVSGNYDLTKTNLYRLGVNQPTAQSFFDVDTSRYCRQMLRVAPARIFRNRWLLTNFATPAPSAGTNLFTFVTQRFVASYQLLNCESLIGLSDPITVTTDANGIATGASLNILSYIHGVESIANEKSADDAADNATFSLQATEQ